MPTRCLTLTTSGAQDEAESTIGIYWMLAVLERVHLPPRMHRLSDEFCKAWGRRMMDLRRNWESYLEGRCSELGIPFVRRRKRSASVDLRELGFAYVKGRVLPYDWKRNRVIEE